MSKYLPLKRHLETVTSSEHPMTFREIERVLGFDLPASAREYPPFWSNTHHNPAVKAFRSAGWKSARVDLGSERLVFVREGGERPKPADPIVTIHLNQLSPTAQKFFETQAAEAGGVEEAVVRFLNREAGNPRKALLDRFKRRSPVLAVDSTALVREDRDDR